MAPATSALLTRLSVALATLFALSLARAATAADDGLPALPPSATGKMPPANVDQAASTLGASGCLLVESADRWTDLLAKLASLGWDRPADFPLAAVDFDKNAVVFVFDCGDEGHAFSLRGTAGGDKARDVDVAMSYIIYKSRAAVVNACKFIAVAVPKADAVKVGVWTYHPMNGGPHPTPEKALLEWSATLPRGGGDVVGGLRGRVEPEAAAVAAGDDILVQFRLEAADGLLKAPPAAQFGLVEWPVCVWDGKYSNGYRNHAFRVVGPDGKARVLRPKVIDNWDKNAPHPVEIPPGKPYALPEWQEGQTFKSLKALGLDTSAPGTYRINGVYAERAGEAQHDGRPCRLWGGELWTNTVTVEVKGK